VPFVALGAGLLWFGWFGFNAGSELTVDAITGVAFLNTQVATAAGLLGWIIVEWFRDGKPTLVGASSGAVAGLVAITPACGFIPTLPAVLLGLVAGAVCALAVSLKYKFGYDDSLDVVGVHPVGGLTGTVLIGLFANVGENVNGTWYPDGALNGLFYGGGVTQLITQVIVALFAIVFSGILTAVIARAIKATMGLRITESDEVSGIDLATHGETAYEGLTTTGRPTPGSQQPAHAASGPGRINSEV
jgi:Amt family ammonium transporter